MTRGFPSKLKKAWGNATWLRGGSCTIGRRDQVPWDQLLWSLDGDHSTINPPMSTDIGQTR